MTNEMLTEYHRKIGEIFLARGQTPYRICKQIWALHAEFERRLTLEDGRSKYNLGEVAGFLRDLQEEKFPSCERWDETDCNCHHCRIGHFADLADKAVEEPHDVSTAN